MAQLADAGGAIHAAGKIHRDLKPSNVLVDGDGRVVVLDFGVALDLVSLNREVDRAGAEVVGTATYMAPEQSDETVPTPAADWYSVGVMLYEALVGQPPYSGAMLDVISLKNTMDAPSPAASAEGVPADLDELCVELLQRDPRRRSGLVEVRRLLGITSSKAPPAPAPYTANVDPEKPFFGREQQTERLRQAHARALEGSPVVALLTGNPGVGKSTMARRFLENLVTETPPSSSSDGPTSARRLRTRRSMLLSMLLRAASSGWWKTAPLSPFPPT
jgi:serine/threonine protein kinase